jgi:hypothetical protein
MTDARTSSPKLRFVQSYTDRHGHARHYFRRPGFKRVVLPGEPWSPEFMTAYSEAAAQPASPDALLNSRLVGGVTAKRGVDPGTVQPLIGVYLLMLRGALVYIGSSLRMPSRVAEHRTNGRPFDQAFYIATKANERERLEATLIRAMNPPQNKVHRTVGVASVAPVAADAAS